MGYKQRNIGNGLDNSSNLFEVKAWKGWSAKLWRLTILHSPESDQ